MFKKNRCFLSCLFLCLFFITFILSPVYSVKAITPTIDKVKMMQDMKAAMEAEWNISSISAVKSVSTETPVVASNATGFYQASPPQIKLAVGVALVGAGVVYGTIKGKNVVQMFQDTLAPDEAKTQIIADANGIIHVSKSMIDKIKSFAQASKSSITPSSSWTVGDIVSFGVSGFGNVDVYVSNYTSYSHLSLGSSALPVSMYTYWRGDYNKWILNVTFSNGTTNELACGNNSSIAPLYTVQLNNVSPTSVDLKSLIGVDGTFSSPSSDLTGTTGTTGEISTGNDLVITPSSNTLNITSSPTAFGTSTSTGTDTGSDTGSDNPIYVDISKNLDVPANDTPTLDFSPLQQSLQNKFPFCIPFDLIHMINSFSSSAKAPVFHISFPSVNLGTFGVMQGYNFDWDFGQFSKIVTIFRYFILIVFVANLIKITKGIIWGS